MNKTLLFQSLIFVLISCSENPTSEENLNQPDNNSDKIPEERIEVNVESENIFIEFDTERNELIEPIILSNYKFIDKFNYGFPIEHELDTINKADHDLYAYIAIADYNIYSVSIRDNSKSNKSGSINPEEFSKIHSEETRAYGEEIFRQPYPNFYNGVKAIYSFCIRDNRGMDDNTDLMSICFDNYIVHLAILSMPESANSELVNDFFTSFSLIY